MLTILIHRRLEAFGEATRATLVSVGLVNRAPTLQLTRCLARVNSIPMNASLEETRTTCEVFENFSRLDGAEC
jgi:hypothetical protein